MFLFKVSKPIFIASFLIGGFSQKAFSDNPQKTREDVLSAFESGNFDLSGWDLSGVNLGEIESRKLKLRLGQISTMITLGFSLGLALSPRISYILDGNLPTWYSWGSTIWMGTILGSACVAGYCVVEKDFFNTYLKEGEFDLTQANLKGAIYDDKTKFPKGTNPESLGMIPKCKTAFLKP